MRLGPDDVNLQTKELHYNYSVLIVSLEQEESSLLHYPTIINFRRIIRRKNYIIIIFPEYDKRLLSVLCYLSHDTLGFCTFHKLSTKLPLYLYTTLTPVGMLSLALLCHNVPLLFSSTLLPNSSSTLAMLFVAWPHALFPLSLLSSTFFLFSALLPLQGMPVPSVSVLFVALLYVPPFPFSSIMDTPYICAPSFHT